MLEFLSENLILEFLINWHYGNSDLSRASNIRISDKQKLPKFQYINSYFGISVQNSDTLELPKFRHIKFQYIRITRRSELVGISKISEFPLEMSMHDFLIHQKFWYIGILQRSGFLILKIWYIGISSPLEFLPLEDSNCWNFQYFKISNTNSNFRNSDLSKFLIC